MISFIDFLIFLGETVASGAIGFGQESFFDILFGRGIDYSTFYNEIRSIVRDELILNDLPKYQGEIDGIENTLKNDYEKNKKNMPYEKIEHKLDVLSSKILTIINTLEQPYYQNRGEVIAIYMEAAYLYLYIQQEIVRQIELVISEGEKSSAIVTKKDNTIEVIKDEAKRFKRSVEKYFKSLVESRMKHYNFKIQSQYIDLGNDEDSYGKVEFIYFDDLSFELYHERDGFPGSQKSNELLMVHQKTIKERLDTVLLVNKFNKNMNKLDVTPVPDIKMEIIKPLKIKAEARVKDKGWLGYRDSNMIIGTTGEARRLNAIRMKIVQQPYNCPNMGIEYRVFEVGAGWRNWVQNGTDAGNGVDNNYWISAIQIRLINNNSDCKIIYRSHMQNRGWTEWVNEGETAGVTCVHFIYRDQEYIRLEAFEFMII